MKRPFAVVIILSLAHGLLGACDRHDHDDDHDHDHDEHAQHGDAPADEHGTAAHGALQPLVRLKPSAVKRSGIRIETARAQALFGGVEVPAEVNLDPDRTAHVSPIVQGQISEVRASIGDRVKAGDVLVVLNSVALGETRAAVAEAQVELSVAKENYERQRELQEAEIGARRNFVEAEGALNRARARLKGLRSRAQVYGRGGSGAQTVVRSPIAGQVLSRHATVGEVVEPGTNLFVVADLSRVWVMGRVFAQDVAAARLEAPATLTLRSLADRSWTGVLDYVAPALDEHTRTLPVRMVLENEDGVLRPGLFGVLRLPGAKNPPAVPTVEAAAVQRIEKDDYIFVPASEEGHFKAARVRVGRSDRGYVEVLDGLRPDQRYVAAGGFVLKSEALRSEMNASAHEH